jgi:hypothetical protein
MLYMLVVTSALWGNGMVDMGEYRSCEKAMYALGQEFDNRAKMIEQIVDGDQEKIDKAWTFKISCKIRDRNATFKNLKDF